MKITHGSTTRISLPGSSAQVVKCLAALLVFLLPLVVTEGATLTGSFNSIATGSNVDLTAAGPTDWVHWGLDSDVSVNRKDGVVPQISDISLLAATNIVVYAFQFGDNANGYSWDDGIPTLAATNTTTGLWAYADPPVGSGFQITAPASTNLRTLNVFVGAFAAQGRFEASLSDASTPAYVETSLSNHRNGPGRVYTIQYAANSTGQTVRIQWTLADTRGQTANVTLQAAALSALGENNPPFVLLTNPPSNFAFPVPASVTLAARASDLDGTISKVEFFEGTNELGAVPSSPFHYDWNASVPGQYFLRAVATDNDGETSTSPPVEVFAYQSGGSLTGSVALPPISVNLTEEGTADWAHWGLVAPASFNHKASVAQRISNFTALGTNAVQRFTDNYTAFLWSDGTPIANASATPTGVYFNGVTNGFQLTVPADRILRRLKVYAGCYGAQAKFQATLSDFSAPPYVDTTTLSNVFGNSYAVFTLDYAAASPGQTVTVTIRSTKLFDAQFGNVTLAAATLQGAPPEPLPFFILNSTRAGNDFILSFATESARTYSIQYTPLLDPLDWQPLTNVTGNGGTVSVTNENVTAAQRFYRVLTQ